MSILNFQSDLIAEPTKSNNVKERNTILCITESFSEVNFDENDFEETAKKVFATCRRK